MLFGEGPQIKNIAADLNKLFRQGSMLNQSSQTVEGDAAADQGTSGLLAARDPVIQEISVGMSGEQSARYTVSGTPPISLPNSLGKPLKAWSVDLLPNQEGTGAPSPSNVRPIHGTSKLNLFVAESYDPTVAPTAIITISTVAGIVYGGSLTVNNGSGQLVVDRLSIIYDGSADENWAGSETMPWRYATSINGIKLGSAISFYVISNLFPTTSDHWSSNNYGILNNYNQIIVGYPPAQNDVIAFRAFLASNPLQVVYLLENPISYNINIPVIPTPLGNATAWATAEDGTVESMEVTYVGKA